MKRRDFLKYSSSAGVGSVLLNSMPVKSFATPNMLPLMDCSELEDRALILVYLGGGNDGLNTIIPLDQYGLYRYHRPTIGLPDTGKGAIVNLDTTLALQDQVGIHSEMMALKEMYDSGRAQILQAVGYPNNNGSHFKSTDIWMTGGDGTSAYNNYSSGWMGRFLNKVYPGMHGNPNTIFQDPLGLQLASKTPSVGFISDLREYVAANLAQQDPAGWYSLVQSIGAIPHLSVPESDYGDQLAYIMSVENNTNIYANRITNVFNAGSVTSTVYPSTSLGNQLKTIARLIDGGCKTKIFLTQIGGFDTHSNQVDDGIPYEGRHANLVSNVFSSIKAFHDDMAFRGMENRVLTLTFSEFGRKVAENGSRGTDHGNLAPMFLFGSTVVPGIRGTNVDLNPSLISSNGNFNNNAQKQFDYRSIYRTLLQDWLGASDEALSTTAFNSFAKLPNMVNPNVLVDPSCYFDAYVKQTYLRLKVVLEGFYDTSTQAMHKKLFTKGLIPLSHPYGDPPYNYTGIESAGSLPPDTVDWILVELRDANNINTVIAQRAALLRTDGVVMEPSGRDYINFIDIEPTEYYIAVYHRNHVPVVSSVVHDTSGNTITTQNVYDFTTSASAAMGTSQLKAVGSHFGLYAGNYDSNGANEYEDYEAWKEKSSIPNQYLAEDGDGNGVVNNLDFNLWKKNESQVGVNIFQP